MRHVPSHKCFHLKNIISFVLNNLISREHLHVCFQLSHILFKKGDLGVAGQNPKFQSSNPLVPIRGLFPLGWQLFCLEEWNCTPPTSPHEVPSFQLMTWMPATPGEVLRGNQKCHHCERSSNWFTFLSLPLFLILIPHLFLHSDWYLNS